MKYFLLTIYLIFLSVLSYAQNDNYFAPDPRPLVTGSDNTFIGDRAGLNTTAASENSFIGSSSGELNTTGSNNSFLGFFSGRNNRTGQDNSFFGHLSGSANTGGSDNVFVGTSSGLGNILGNENTYIGKLSGFRFNGSGNTFIGFEAGNGVFQNSSGSNNTSLGHQSAKALTTGVNNTMIGKSAGELNAEGSNNVFLGFEAGYNELGSNKLYIANGRDNTLIYGDFTNGRIGIGNSSPAERLEINGAIKIANSTNEDNGTIRWTGNDFEGRKGDAWVTLTADPVDEDALLNRISDLETQVANLTTRLEALENAPNAINDEFNENVLLQQNEPNPFSEDTRIRFNIPVRSNQSILIIYDMSGKQLEKFNIMEKGEGAINIKANSLQAGMYIYTLILDGKVAASKRMILLN